jgi:hypothetical protein
MTGTTTPLDREGCHRKTEHQGPVDHLQAWTRRFRSRICQPWGRPRPQPPPSASRPNPAAVAICAPCPTVRRVVGKAVPLWHPAAVPCPRPWAPDRAKIMGDRTKRKDPRRHQHRPDFARSCPVVAMINGVNLNNTKLKFTFHCAMQMMPGTSSDNCYLSLINISEHILVSRDIHISHK